MFEDGYVHRMFDSLQTALPSVDLTSYFTINGTSNPLQQPVPLALGLFATADHRSTIFLFPDIDVVAEAVSAALSVIHTSTAEYEVLVTSLDKIGDVDSSAFEVSWSPGAPWVQCDGAVPTRAPRCEARALQSSRGGFSVPSPPPPIPSPSRPLLLAHLVPRRAACPGWTPSPFQPHCWCWRGACGRPPC